MAAGSRVSDATLWQRNGCGHWNGLAVKRPELRLTRAGVRGRLQSALPARFSCSSAPPEHAWPRRALTASLSFGAGLSFLGVSSAPLTEIIFVRTLLPLASHKSAVGACLLYAHRNTHTYTRAKTGGVRAPDRLLPSGDLLPQSGAHTWAWWIFCASVFLSETHDWACDG